MRVQVETYVDEGGVEKLRRIRFDGRVVEVADNIDQWHGAGYRYIKVKDSDGNAYILRHSEAQAEWELTMYQGSQLANARTDLDPIDQPRHGAETQRRGPNPKDNQFGVRQMRTFPLDIDPAQVVRWIMAEHQAVSSRFRILARRASEVRDIPTRRELHLGDREREELSEVDTIAVLEIAPAHASEGWLLTVEVEDEAGPRLPEKGTLAAPEGPIDLRGFYDEFIRPGRGIANVVAGVEDDKAEVCLNELISSIEKDRHAPDLGRREGQRRRS